VMRTTRRATVTISAEQVQRFLASDAGRRLRVALAAGLVLSAPLLFRMPVLRRYPLLRILEMLGGAALLVKLAEALREWDPVHPHPVILEVDGVPPRRDV
jgi:hypothetical protein